MNASNMLGHLVFGMLHQFRPRSVWCKGEQLLRDYMIDKIRFEPHFSENNTRMYIESSTEKLWNILSKE